MKFLLAIIVYFTFINTISAVSIGVIYNASLMMMSSPSNITISGPLCKECLCAMLMSSRNSSIVSLNCYMTNMTNVRYELFTILNYQITLSYQIGINFESTLYFLQLLGDILYLDIILM